MPRPIRREAGVEDWLAAEEQAVTGADRYIDLCLVLRRLTVDLPGEVPEGWALKCGEVELVTAAPGREGVPVVSTPLGASRVLQDGAALESGGVLHAETVLRAGGRWDTLHERYDGEAAAPLVFDLIEAQIEPAVWVAKWLERYASRQGAGRRRQKDVRTLLNYGNRGGGKTVLGLLCTVAVCLAVPKTTAWIISRSRTQSQDEIHDAMLDLLPASWYAYQGQPAYRFRLINKSKIRELTADAPEDLKQGRVDWAFLNEAAKMSKLSYGYPIGRISDRGGLCFIASNPPTADVPRGEWVWRLYRKIKERKALGEWTPIEVIQTDAAGNAAIDQAAREDVGIILHMLDPTLAAADADGTMQGTVARLLYEYERARHGLRPPPDIGLEDITERFTKGKYGRGFPYLAGCDFQDTPYIIASFWKLYTGRVFVGEREIIGTAQTPILWCISDFTCRGSEDDFLDEVLHQGIITGAGTADEIEAGTVLWIGDCSALWQDRKHRGSQAAALPPSFSFWKQRGLHIIPPTVKITDNARFPKNPPLQVSYGQINRQTKEGRMLLSPLATVVQEAFAECGAKRLSGGGVIAEPKYAHAIDTARYVAWWVDPVTKRRAQGSEERRGPGVTILPAR